MCRDTLTKLKSVLHFSQNTLLVVAVVVNVYQVQRKKKHYNFSELVIIEIVFFALLHGGIATECLICVSAACNTVQGHICCFKASFLQMVIQECIHTVLMEEYLR